MSRFRKESGKSTPAISTASLPDIVFMLLFFFIVATVEREDTFQVNFTRPEASQIQEVEDRSTVKFIYVGELIDKSARVEAGAVAVQVNGQIVKIDDVGGIAKEHMDDFLAKGKVPVISLKIDEKTEMDAVNNIKMSLRDAEVYKALYSMRDKVDK